MSDKYVRLEGWSDQFYGTYSDKKIKLMCSVFDLTLADFQPDALSYIERKVLGQNFRRYLDEEELAGGPSMKITSTGKAIPSKWNPGRIRPNNDSEPMKKSCLFAASALLLLLGGCYGDKGNYDYRDINEIVIGARGFEGVEYKLRSGIDELKISPHITASQDPELTGTYEYEWVVVGRVRNPGERTTIARTRDLDYAVNLPSDDYSLLLRITDPARG